MSAEVISHLSFFASWIWICIANVTHLISYSMSSSYLHETFWCSASWSKVCLKIEVSSVNNSWNNMSQTEIQSVDPFWGEKTLGVKHYNQKLKSHGQLGIWIDRAEQLVWEISQHMTLRRKRANHTLSDVHGSRWLRRF